MPDVITLDNIIQIYTQLEASFAQLPESITRQFPRDVDKLGGFLRGYSGQIYQIDEFDFYELEGVTPELVSHLPAQREAFSFCQIFSRAAPNPGSLEKVERLVRIYVNTHVTEQGPLVNNCWNRFCQIKEMCQAILFEELNTQTPDLYPATTSYSQVVMLFSDINNKPFSLVDFGNPNYPKTLGVENAAELLATMLLVPIDELHGFRHDIIKTLGQIGLGYYDYFKVADFYKTPRRYIEIVTAWEHFDDFMSKLNTARSGLML